MTSLKGVLPRTVMRNFEIEVDDPGLIILRRTPKGAAYMKIRETETGIAVELSLPGAFLLSDANRHIRMEILPKIWRHKHIKADYRQIVTSYAYMATEWVFWSEDLSWDGEIAVRRAVREMIRFVDGIPYDVMRDPYGRIG